MALPIIFQNPWIRWGWGIPFFLLLWWLTRKLRQDPDEAPEPDWIGRPLWFPLQRLDWVSLSICLGTGICFWIGRNSINPYPPDSIYHMLVARKIYETGAIPMWCDWQYYPLGRPHLYPPLFHLVLAAAGWLHNGDILAGYRFTESFALPFIFFSTWYVARWLFDAPRAFVALLIVGMDYSLIFTAAMGTPSVLGTSLFSVMIVFFFSGRWLWATILCVIMIYTHMGIAPIALGTLTVFSLLHRRYMPYFLAIAIISLIAFLPWYARLYVFGDWFKHPLEDGVYGSIDPDWMPFYKFTWLQFVSFTMLVIVARAFRGLRWRERRNQILLIAVAASLPMLFSYGGRFYTHTLHFWAIIAAGIFARFLIAPVRPKRILAFCLLALTPTIGIMGTGTPIPAGVYPSPSAWFLAPLAASRILEFLNESQPWGYVTWRQAAVVADRIKETTEPGQAIYFQEDRDLALVVEWLADRPIETGAWEETRPNKQARKLIDWAAERDPNGCWVSRSSIGFPPDVTVEEIEGLYFAVRGDGETRKDKKKEKKELKRIIKSEKRSNDKQKAAIESPDG